MGIFIKRAKNDKGYRPNFWMYYREGRRIEVELKQCPVRGKPPATLSQFDKGDDVYERSKAKALEVAARFDKDRKIKGGTESLMEQLIASKNGQKKIEYVKIQELYSRWCQIIRRREPTESRKKQAKFCFDEFSKFIGKKRFLYEVNEGDVRDFYKYLVKLNYSPATIRDKISALRSAFARYLPVGTTNPFKNLNLRTSDADGDRIGHKPLTLEEYAKVLKVAADGQDPTLLDIAVGCGETGMRSIDVCHLKWESINFAKKTIRCMTSKKNRIVTIPISDELMERLKIAEQKKTIDSVYVWPDAASLYDNNHSGFVKRGKDLFACALFSDIDEPETITIEDGKKKELTVLELEDLIKSSKYLDSKKEKLLKVIWGRHYGKKPAEIARENGFTKGQVSEYLKEILEDFGADLRPHFTPLSKKRKMLEATRQKRKEGIYSGCLYGWHSFRTSFATRALLAGQPEEAVKLIVGHRDFETTQKYYFNPTDAMMESFRKHLNDEKRQRTISFEVIDTEPMEDVAHAETPTALPPPAESQQATLPVPCTPCANQMKLSTIIASLPDELKAKIKDLPQNAKEEFRDLTTLADAEAFLSLY